MSETPSKRRRKGREEFISDGWKEAEEAHNQEFEDKEPEICPCCGREMP